MFESLKVYQNLKYIILNLKLYEEKSRLLVAKVENYLLKNGDLVLSFLKNII